MPDSSLGSVVRCLRLRHVDNGTRHATNADNAAWRTTTHQVLGSLDTEEICSVDVDTPELLHALVRVCDGFVVFAETGGGDEAVDFAVLFDDGREGFGDGLGGGDITEVAGDEGNPVGEEVSGISEVRKISRSTSWNLGSRCARCHRPPSRLSWPHPLHPLSALTSCQHLLQGSHTIQVHNSNVGTTDNHSLRHNQPKTTRTTSDDTGLALEGEGS